MIKFQPYPKYKDSGMPWLGSIPWYWDCLPHRAIFEEIKERGHVNEPLLSVTIGKGIIHQKDLLENSSKKDSSNLDKSKYKLVESGDIVYNKMRAWQGAVGVSKYRGIVSPAYIVQRLRGDQKPDYYHYLFRTPIFAKEAERWSYGITSDQWSLRPEHFKMIYSCVPPLKEQELIVRFLGKLDYQIHRFIRNRRQLINVLNEQKRAIINRAVTHGLDSNVRLKPSGIDWLGDIPEHWEVRKLGNIGSFSKGRGISRADITDSGVPAITYGDIYTTYDIEAKQLEKYTSAEIATNSQEIIKGDLLFTASGETIEDIGKTTLYSNDKSGYAGGDIIILRLAEGDGLYLSYVLNSSMGVYQKSLFGRGDIIVHIAASKLKQIIVPFPSKEEQILIARFLDDFSNRVHAAISRAQHEIDLIREYRISLISDVVTGKVDVRNLVPSTGSDIIDEMNYGIEPLGDMPEKIEKEDLSGKVNV